MYKSAFIPQLKWRLRINLYMQILARAVGRRKEAVAQIQIIKGTGKFIINNKPAEQYLQNNACALISIKAPFSLCQLPNASPTDLSPNQVNPNEALVSTVLNTNVPSSKSPFFLKLHNKKEKKVEDNLSNSVGVVPATGVQVPELEKTMPASHDTKNISLQLNFDQIDTIVKVKGGGLMGQTDAIKLGVARAICSINDFSLFIAGDSKELLSSTMVKEPSLEEIETVLVMPSSTTRENVQSSLQVNPETEELTQDVAQSISALQDIRKLLKTKGYLTQDARVKERRKYGLKKARKASQYHKR